MSCASGATATLQPSTPPLAPSPKPLCRPPSTAIRRARASPSRGLPQEPGQAQLGGAEGNLLAGVGERDNAGAERGTIHPRAVGGPEIAQHQALTRIIGDLRMGSGDTVVIDDELGPVAVAADGPGGSFLGL